MDLFPSIFHVAQEKEASVAESIVIDRDLIQRNIIFSKAIQDWKISSFKNFFSLLYSLRPRTQDPNKLWWEPISKVLFKVHTFYKSLSQSQHIQYR